MKKTLLAMLVTVAFSANANTHTHTEACKDAIEINTFSVGVEQIKAQLSSVLSVSAATPVVVDLMAFYQPSYEEKMGSQWVHQRIQHLVDNTNTGLQNSGLNVTIRLVNAQPISGIPNDLHYSSTGEGGNVVRGAGSLASSLILNPYSDFAENKIYEKMGADIALYIRDYNADLQPNDSLGFGELGGELTTVFDTAVLEETNPLYPQGEYVLAHEIGHNFNAGHLTDDGGYTFLPQAHAFTCAGRTTIMGPADPNGHRFFSSPTKMVNGEACGLAGTADNTAVIAEYAPAAAARRTAPAAKGTVFFTDTVYQHAPGSTTVTVSVKRDGDLSEEASVQIGTVDGTAKAGLDFADTANRVEFAPGQDTAVFTFSINATPKGKASLVMRYPYKLTTTDSSAAVLFTEEVPGKFGFASPSVTVAENAGTLNLTINRTGGSDGSKSVRVYTEDGTRKSGTDYTSYDQIVKFADGEESKTVTITLIDNAAVDADGTFSVKMSGIDGSDIDTNSSGVVVTMTNNDVATTPGGGNNGGNNGGGSSESGSGGGSLGWFSLAFLLAARLCRGVTKR